MEPPLLTVEKSLFLTGLGMLLLPTGQSPALRSFALHTKFLVTLTFPDGQQQTAPASVEELSRPVAGSEPLSYADAYVLLLESAELTAVPAGTTIRWAGAADDPFALLR